MRNDEPAKWVLAVAMTASLVACALVLRGFALRHLWEWFVVPFGLPAIGIAWAIGIGIMISLASPTPRGEAEGWETFTSMFFTPLVALLIGFVAKQFM